MSDTKTPPASHTSISPAEHPTRPTIGACNDEAMICERCGKAEMYRMHAVWRCPDCGFKTDCCGW